MGTFTHTSQNLSEGWGGGHQLLGVLAMAVYLSQMSRKIASCVKGSLHIGCVGVDPRPRPSLALPTGPQCPSCMAVIRWGVCGVLSLGTADKCCHHSCVCEPQFREPTMFICVAYRMTDLACSHLELAQAGHELCL